MALQFAYVSPPLPPIQFSHKATFDLGSTIKAVYPSAVCRPSSMVRLSADHFLDVHRDEATVAGWLFARFCDLASIDRVLTLGGVGEVVPRPYGKPLATTALTAAGVESQAISINPRQAIETASGLFWHISDRVQLIRSVTTKFGKADMAEQIKQVRRQYEELRQAVAAGVNAETGAPVSKAMTAAQKEAEIKRLVAREKNDIRDLQAVRDMVRGSYLAKENSSNFARVARVAGTINYLRVLGGVTLSSVTDISRHVMVHGLSSVMRDGLVPMVRNLKGFKMSVHEAKLAGAVTERLLNTRMATWSDINDPYSMGSPFERFVENAANGFSRANGMVYWNDFQKSFASVLTQSRVLRGAGNYSGLGKREKAYLAYLGIDGSMAERIARQFEAHGSIEDGGVRVAGSDDWDDEWARRVYRAAVNKDVSATIIDKGVGDVPLFMKTPAGALLMQFKGFALASHQRALMRGLQERPMGFVSGTMVATTVGMMLYWLKSVEANRQDDISDNAGRWIAEGLDRSGMFTLAFEVNNTVEKALGIGAYGALSAAFPNAGQGGPASRYAARSTVAGFTGPTGDLVDTLVRAAQAIKGSGDGFSAGDINSIKRLLPGATLPGIRSLVEYLGVPAVEQAMGVD